MNYYLNKVRDAEYYPLRDNVDVWVDLENEGIFEEYEYGNFIDNWVVAKLIIDEEDKKGLINLDTETVEFFNELDISIKEEYNLKVIDFINYDNGDVFLIKYLK